MHWLMGQWDRVLYLYPDMSGKVEEEEGYVGIFQIWTKIYGPVDAVHTFVLFQVYSSFII